jgi:hypothetical protein
MRRGFSRSGCGVELGVITEGLLGGGFSGKWTWRGGGCDEKRA